MFFVARSFVCIGLVASALPVPAGSVAPGAGDLLQNAALSSTAALERYCAQNPARCLAVARIAAEPARLPENSPPRKLRSMALPPNLRS